MWRLNLETLFLLFVVVSVVLAMFLIDDKQNYRIVKDDDIIAVNEAHLQPGDEIGFFNNNETNLNAIFIMKSGKTKL